MLELILALLLETGAVAPPAAAQPQPADDGVQDASFAEPDGDRVIHLSTLVPAPPERVWEALTTADGWRRMGVRSAAVDFQVGGIIETNYKPDVPVGSRGNIRNEIVAYVPGRVLVIRNVQAPPGFAHPEEFSKTATVLELAPEGAGTRLSLAAVGFRPGAAYDALYSGFRAGNRWSLAAFARSFAAAPLEAPSSAAGGPKGSR